LHELELLREKMRPWPAEHQQLFLGQLDSLEAESKVAIHAREGDRLWKSIERHYDSIRNIFDDTRRHGPALEEHVNAELEAVHKLMVDERDLLSVEQVKSITGRSRQADRSAELVRDMESLLDRVDRFRGPNEVVSQTKATIRALQQKLKDDLAANANEEENAHQVAVAKAQDIW
jgi:hypothetical protein